MNRIKDEAAGLVSWCRAFVGRVEDHRHNNITADFFEVLASLEARLEAKPTAELLRPAPRCPVGDCLHDRETRRCVICGWSL